MEITHERGSFSGQLFVSLTGSMNKAKADWNAAIRNTSPRRLFEASLCVKAFDSAGQQLKPGGNECVLVFATSNWDPGVSLNFKGKQNFKISDQKTPIQVARFTVTAAQVLDHLPNIRHMDVPCAAAWTAVQRAFTDKNFRPAATDNARFSASYTLEGGKLEGYADAKQMLDAFTNANTAFANPVWEAFRIDTASVSLREEKPGKCTADIKMGFSGYGKPYLGSQGWYTVESTYKLEKAILDQADSQLSK